MDKDLLHATAVLPPVTLKYGDGWPSEIRFTCGQKKIFLLALNRITITVAYKKR